MDADIIVVGAGSSGSVIANRPSAAPSVRVLLPEAGGLDTYPWIRVHAPLDGMISQEFRPPGDLAMDDDEGTLDWARDNSVSIYHPAGTCKMGTGADAVVDPALRVHGMEGLRVADCSIMPEIISGNTNAPAIMIGEKAGDLILGR